MTTAVVRFCVTSYGVNRQKVTHAWKRSTRHSSAAVAPVPSQWRSHVAVGPMLSHLPFPASLTEGSDDSVPEVPLRLARQGSRRFRRYATMPKASRVLAALTPTRWHSAQQQVIVTAPPCIGGRDSKTRCCDEVCACQPASPCVVPAGNPSAGYGGRGVGASCPPAIITHRFSSHAPSATFIGGGVRLHARSPP